MPILSPAAFSQTTDLSQFLTPPLTEGVGSPLWWLYRLAGQLQLDTVGFIERTADGVCVYRVGSAKLDRYYNGHFDLPWIDDADTAAAYRAMLERSKSNFMRVVADVAAERVNVLGLRLPGDTEAADSDTWAIWTRNDMERWFPTGVQTALVQRRAFWSVWWDEADSSKAKIALEDPQQVAVEYEPGDRTQRAAGVKLWTDDWTGSKFANVAIRNDKIFRFRYGKPSTGPGPEGWYERADPLPNPLRVVPFIPMVNRPGLNGRGVSRIEDVLAAQDRINQTLFSEQVAEHLGAFKQMWATGLSIPVDEETGQPIQPYKAALDKLWVSEDEKARFGQFDAVDLENYWKSIEGNLEHISVTTRTPRHAFMHQGQAPSGDAMKSDESGLVADVKGMWSPFGSAVRETLSLARTIEGFETPFDAEIVWGDPEFQTLGQLVDAQLKLVQAGVASLDYAREKVGMSPATIKRVRAERLRDSLEAEAFAPEPEVAPSGPGTGPATVG